MTSSLDFDVVQYLANKNIRTFPTGKGTEVTTHCWNCPDGDPKGKGKLYINTTDGWMHCKRCGLSGGTYIMQESLGDDPRSKKDKTPDPSVRRRILRWAAEVGASMLSNNDDQMLYLVGEERGLWAETLVDRQLGFIGNSWSLTQSLPEEFTAEELKRTGLVYREGPRAGKDFFYNHLLIPYVSRGAVTQIRGRHVGDSKGGKYMTGPGEDVQLYNLDDLDEATDVVITEGEFDTMILKQVFATSPEARIRDIAVVACPGAGAFKEEFARYFSDIQRVYVGFDSDDEGKKGAIRIKELIGTRTRIIEWPKHLVDQAFQMHLKKLDWSDYVNKMGAQWQDVLELMSTAGGKRLFSMREAGVAFRNAKSLSDGVKTGFVQLDSTIKPGLLPGQVMVVLAKTGTGKGHPVDTEVPTPQGWRKWGDLQVGDEVFGAGGAATSVTAVYDRGYLPTYRVCFSDGTSVLADGEHIWQVAERRGAKREWTSFTKTTVELVREGLRHNKEYRFIVPMGEPVQYLEADLPVGPYTMGALLANGGLTGTSAILTTPDPDVADRVAMEHPISKIADTTLVCDRYLVQGVIGACRGLGVAVPSGAKHIPASYLTASVAQRRNLLAGLLDGDGSSRIVNNRCSIRYSTTSADLARDVVELVQSLSGTATWTQRRRSGRQGSYIEHTLSIMLDYTGFTSVRKTPSPLPGFPKYARVPRRAIIDITREADSEIRCITVAAADQLYRIGRSYTVTHNTIICCNMAYNMRSRRVLFISLEQTREEVYDRLRKIYLFWHPKATDEVIEHELGNIYINDENRLTEKDLGTLIAEYEVETGKRPDVVYVDYLGYFARGVKGSTQYERVTNAVMQLKADAKSQRVVIISPSQVNRLAKEGKPIDLDDARDSVTGDTLVTLADGRRVCIENLVGQTPDVVALHPDFQHRIRQALRVWRKSEREVFEVTTQSGRRVKVTPEHPFFTLEGWKKLSELAPGESIAVPTEIPVFGTTCLPHAELLGHLLADAHLGASPVAYTEGNRSVREHVTDLARGLGVRAYDKKGEPFTVVFPFSERGRIKNPLTEYLRDQGVWGLRSPERFVPDAVWQAPREDAAAFIRGLWTSDGCITDRGLQFSSASEELARGVQSLLVRFGVHSFLTHEAYGHGGYVEGKYWRVMVRESDALVRFAKEIGLAGDKGLVLESFALSRANARCAGRTMRSLPVEVWRHIHSIRRQKGLTWEQAFGNSGVDERRRLTVERAAVIAENLDDDWLRNLVNGSLRFETVSVRPAGREWVYDMTVRGLSNFVANDITVKNSGAIEETADFLLSVFRPDDGIDNTEGSFVPSGRLRMGVLKSRHGGKDRTFSLQMDMITLAIVDAEDSAERRAREHNYKHGRGWDWERLRREQLAPVQETLT